MNDRTMRPVGEMPAVAAAAETGASNFTSTVFVFTGSQATFPAGVFSDRELAIAWITEHRLTGTLTEYPVDVSVYDWAVGNGYFKPKRAEQQTPYFIGKFSSALQWHMHFEDGVAPGSNHDNSDAA